MTSISDCVICIEELTDKGIIKVECEHIFHKKCFNTYVEHKIKDRLGITCPLCRKEIEVKLTKRQKMKKFMKKIKKSIGNTLKFPITRYLIMIALVLIIISVV